MGQEMPPNCYFPWGFQELSNTWFLKPTWVHIPNGISISSAILAQLISRHTDHNTSVTTGRTDHNCPRCGQTPQTQNIGSTALALNKHDCKFLVPLSTLSKFLGKSVALARHTLWRVGAYAINNSTDSKMPNRCCHLSNNLGWCQIFPILHTGLEMPL